MVVAVVGAEILIVIEIESGVDYGGHFRGRLKVGSCIAILVPKVLDDGIQIEIEIENYDQSNRKYLCECFIYGIDDILFFIESAQLLMMTEP